MSDYTKSKIKIVVYMILFLIAFYMQCFGQSMRNSKGLLLQAISLTMFLLMLYFYNKKNS